jgi:transcriptional regulator with XRE-family HTH domain
LLVDARRATREVEEGQMIITAAQVREARKLLGWSGPSLAAKSAVDAKHLDAFERGKRRMSLLDLSVIQRTLAAAGIEFIAEHGAAGVRLRKGK